MMKKQPKKKTRLEELDEQSQTLQKRLMQAYSAGMSYSVIQQLEAMIEQNKLDMYDESEMEKHRAAQKNGDSDSYIV
jgi:uncharacterized protein YacL (UPF0231 family)